MPSDYGDDDLPQDQVRPRDQASATQDATIMRSMQGLSPSGTQDTGVMEAAEATAREWKDLGMQDVPVKDLPWPEGINGPQDFKKITYDDAVKAVNDLKEIQPLAASGYKSEDFARMDAAAGQDWATGKQRVYDLFYGSDPIRVSRDGDQYSIDKGRHRVFVAKEAGLATVPARVFARI